MPSKTPKQKHFMAMSSSKEGRTALKKYGKKPAPIAVAKEYLLADQAKKKKK